MCYDATSTPDTVLTNWNWDDISWSGNNTGDACNLFDTDGDGKVNYAVCVTIGGASAAIQSTTTYSCGDGKSDRCTEKAKVIPTTNTTCSVSPSADDPFPTGGSYPNDTKGSCTVALDDFGSTISSASLIDVCSYPSQQPNSDPSDCIIATQEATGKLEVVKALVPSTDPGRFDLSVDGATLATNVGNGGTTGEQVVLAAAGGGTPHTFGEAGYGGTDLADYSTSVSCRDTNGTGSVVSTTGTNPWSVTVVKDKDVVCTITNSLTQGTLRVIKNVVNDNGGGLVASNFTLHVKSGGVDVAGSPALGSATGTVYTLASGGYVVSENTPPSGYTQTGFSGDCDSNGNVTVVPGVEKSCTITNNDIQPLLTVTKVVTNDNGGTKQVSDFPLFVGQTSVTSGVQNGFNVGPYTVSETNLAGYTAVISGDCTSNGSVTLAPGDVKACTITNNDVAPTLTLVKTVINNNGGNNVVSDFVLRIDGNAVTSGAANVVSAGAHTASEVSLSGYTASAWGGDCAANGTITLNPGDTKTCSITNDDVSPTVTLIKSVTNNYGGGAGVNDFGLTIGGTSVTSGQTLNVNANTPIALNEAGLSGYSFVSMTGTNCPTQLGGTVTLTEGQNVTCTITNDDQAAHLVVVKHVVNDNGGQSSASGFTMTINGVTATGGNSFAGAETPGTDKTLSTVGNYNVTETGPSGYSSSYSADCSGTIALGQTKTCTVTNSDITPRLTVIKHVVNNVGSDNIAGDFTMYVDGTNVSDTSFPGNESGTTVTLDQGSFIVSEDTTPIGFTATFEGDCDGSINVGEEKTCTVTNTRDTGTITVNKVLDPDSDQGLFDLLINGVTEASEVGNGGTTGQVVVGTGDHSVSELGSGETDLKDYVSEISCDNDQSTEGTSLSEISISKDEDVVCTITNTRLSAIGDFIWQDNNGNGIQDPGEPGISGVDVYLYQDDGDNIFEPGTDDPQVTFQTTGGSGLYLFTNLVPGSYWVDVDESTVPAGFANTFAPVSQPIALGAGVTYWLADFGYVPPRKEIQIAKSNDKGSGFNPGDTVNYTLNVTNTGNVTLNNLVVKDVMPGGFSYVTGSSLIDGVVSADPTVASGVLTWTLGTITDGQIIKIEYKVLTSSDLVTGSYKNFATCTAYYRENDNEETLGIVECNVATSMVSSGHSTDFGGNLNAQVLGASTELPATGSGTWILIFSLTLGVTGVGLRLVSRKNKKYGKN
ncbi:DUF11 domain-containing protein [Candidatus Woesebacteria bacterium]|nr:DUF11 domain-containing protein [Candidatus Woesebacteria bacterium]